MQTKIFSALLLLSLCALPAFAEKPEEGFHNESEAGVVIASGNTRSQTYNLKQSNSYLWSENSLKFNGKLLESTAKGVESVRYWSLGLRYERQLSESFSWFLAQAVESDIFAGFDPRYVSDVGVKYLILKTEELSWLGEAGYRYTNENRGNNVTVGQHYARLYSEVTKEWSKSASSKLWLELLPNFSSTDAYQINGEVSVSALLTSIFSIKSAFLVKYNNGPAPGVTEKTDSLFTTSLVAKL